MSHVLHINCQKSEQDCHVCEHAVVIAVFGNLNLADSGMIRVLLTNGRRSVIRAFLEAPQELATALQAMASAQGFKESSMILLLTYANTLAVQALQTSPEKIERNKVIHTGKLQPVLIWREKPVLPTLLSNLEIPVPALYAVFRTKWREIS